MKTSFLNLFFILTATLLRLMPAYSGEAEYIKISGFTQGTTYHITYQNTVHRSLQQEVEQRLQLIDQIFSTYNPQSLVSRINNSAVPVTIVPMMEQLLKKCFEVNHETQGAFDITVGPLVEAWGFGKSQQTQPLARQVDSLLKIVGMEKIHLKKRVLTKADSRIKLDFNAIAQGYTVDFLSQYFDSLGITNYLIEVGGELYAKGVNASGQPWRIGVEAPVDNNQLQGEQIQKIIVVTNKAVSTSGNYRRFYVRDGVKYAHTINPHTGYPARNTLLSVTIVAPNCTDADAYATACMVMGLEKAIQFVKSKPQLAAYFIFGKLGNEYGEYTTDNFKKLIVE
ncbi:MAG TPA: FAD:protein FMN transferase [Bacteroidales bacterium]|nr:FAD:protein FMN transferase [Bacteroidales bacterium]HOK99059.1 FAD:protein FMN transferase [Bacteroidales bacterium]HPO65903.1 FAD:protein FMN transferase [Bacteroidales bacterium]